MSAPDMTLRDWLASQALPAVIAMMWAANDAIPDHVLKELFGDKRGDARREDIAAALAYNLADAMLRRRREPVGRNKAAPDSGR